MKRRTGDFKTSRRPIKRNKITDGICGNSSTFFFYLKFLMLWICVISVDYLTELRFEYIWPFYLLLRSVYDSYNYKGLAFSFLFICIAITSDLICLFFIPVQWLFFAASTFVWVQYVWHTDKGICLPTIILWALFVYVEAKVRWKDDRNLPHLDLCRPFAAHSIGYPVVTLGFGFKSYVGYRIRQRKQKEVAKENEFYMQLLQQALPKDESLPELEPQKDILPVSSTVSPPTFHKNAQNTQAKLLNGNGHVPNETTSHQNGGSHHHKSRKSAEKENKCDLNNSSSDNNIKKQSNLSSYNNLKSYQYNQLKDVNHRSNDLQVAPTSSSTAVKNSPFKTSKELDKENNHNFSCANSKKEYYEKDKFADGQKDKNTHKLYTEITPSEVLQPVSEVIVTKRSKQKDNHNQYHQQINTQQPSPSDSNHATNGNSKPVKCETCVRLETEAKRLKSELNVLKHLEIEMREKNEMNSTIKTCLQAKQKEIDEMHNKIQELTNLRYMDHQNFQTLERRLIEERRNRQSSESQLTSEKKFRKQAEDKAASRIECNESCKLRKMHLENDYNKMRRELANLEESKQNLDKQNRIYEQELRKFESEMRNREPVQNKEVLMSALSAMQEKNTTLEKNLSAETRVKLDLFSALGEAKRQLEIRDEMLRRKDRQLGDIEAKTAQLLAVSDSINLSDLQMMPQNCSINNYVKLECMMENDCMNISPMMGQNHSNHNNHCSNLQSTSPSAQQQQQVGQIGQQSSDSNLDPNATSYTPKNSMVGTAG